MPVNKLLPGAQNGLIVSAIIETGDSAMLIGSDKGFVHLLYNRAYELRHFQNKLTNIKGPVKAATLYKNSVFFASNFLFEFDLRHNTLQQIADVKNNQLKNWLININAITVYDNCLWVAANDRLARADLRTPFLYPVTGNTGNVVTEHVYTVFPFEGKKLMVGTSNEVFNVYDNNIFKGLRVNDRCTYNEIDSFNLILSCDNRLLIYKPGGLTAPIQKRFAEFANYASTVINGIIKCPDDKFVLSTEDFRGLLYWDKKSKTIRQIDTKDKATPLASNVINTVKLIDNRFIVVHDKAISILDNEITNVVHKELKNSQNQVITILMDLVKTPRHYWISAYNTGLVRLDTAFNVEKIYTIKDGLADLGVYSLFNVADSSIYITTDNGLSVFDIAEDKFYNYYSKDGLHSNIFEEGCGIVGKDGKIYAGGVNGYSVINPAARKKNIISPLLFFDKILIKTQNAEIDTIDLTIKKIIVPDNVLQTKIMFTALNWSSPEKINYKYRIVEKGKDWIDLNNVNFITLIGLSPGTYHLQVKAANEDGVWSEPKELILTFEPKWFQTKLFYLLIVLAIAAILYALYRYRISQIKKQHEIRKNIATDLHDDLGSTLNSVKVFTNLAISGVKQEESLQQVKDNLTEATVSLRDMIWVLDDSLDTVDELITRLKQFAIPVAAASNIEAIIKAESDVNSRQLTKEEKRNLFLICKEAINNSIKYSGASRIDVDIAASGKKIQIVVADNGKGFNMDEVKKGYGLKNMQYRAGQIKYKVALVSSPGNGTQITILPS
jgi:signal transduction histidine kinase